MSNVGESLLRGAREALNYARGARDGFVRHVPERQALFVEELADDELEAISRAEVPVGHEHLNREFES